MSLLCIVIRAIFMSLSIGYSFPKRKVWRALTSSPIANPVHHIFIPQISSRSSCSSNGQEAHSVPSICGIMVVFLDLDEGNVSDDPHADPHEPRSHYRWPTHQPEQSTTTATGVTLNDTGVASLLAVRRTNPNINSCSAALACYPYTLNMFTRLSPSIDHIVGL